MVFTWILKEAVSMGQLLFFPTVAPGVIRQSTLNRDDLDILTTT